MATSINTLIVEGTFEELAEEFATYLDNFGAAQGQTTGIHDQVQPLLQDGTKKEDVLKKLVSASTVLSAAPEKEYLAAYNQLIQLVRQAPKPDIFLARICQNLTQPSSSSTINTAALQLTVLSTIFNTIPAESESRYHVLLAVISVIRKSTSSFEILRPQLKTLDLWLQSWDLDKEDTRKLYLAISETAGEAGDAAASYQYLLRALRTVQDGSDASSDEAKTLSVKAVTTALASSSTYDFSDLTALESVQALRKSEPNCFDLLEVFATENLEDYHEYLSAHQDWADAQKLPGAVLERKMRLLTLSSLAASSNQTRSLPYASIAKALKIDASEVEMWVIDVIRAGLVEGRLSQSNQTFLIHRATYRVFGEHQWREVAARLDMWKNSLESVLRVLGEQKREYAAEKEREARDEQQQQSGGQRGGYRGGNRGFQRRDQQQQQQSTAVEVE